MLALGLVLGPAGATLGTILLLLLIPAIAPLTGDPTALPAMHEQLAGFWGWFAIVAGIAMAAVGTTLSLGMAARWVVRRFVHGRPPEPDDEVVEASELRVPMPRWTGSGPG